MKKSRNFPPTDVQFVDEAAESVCEDTVEDEPVWQLIKLDSVPRKSAKRAKSLNTLLTQL